MRGLKFAQHQHLDLAYLSHPIRDAWIEISSGRRIRGNMTSHPIRDAWIEIGRTPRHYPCRWSHPIRDAWIEITAPWKRTCRTRRIPYGMRGLKFRQPNGAGWRRMSHPIRDAWIEMETAFVHLLTPDCRIPYGMRGLKFTVSHHNAIIRVASHTGCVD